jgi:hypothetical protein
LSELHTVHMTNPFTVITASSPAILSVDHYRSVVDMIYLLNAIGMTPGGSSTVHIYTQTIHRTTQLTEQHI